MSLGGEWKEAHIRRLVLGWRESVRKTLKGCGDRESRTEEGLKRTVTVRVEGWAVCVCVWLLLQKAQ